MVEHYPPTAQMAVKIEIHMVEERKSKGQALSPSSLWKTAVRPSIMLAKMPWQVNCSQCLEMAPTPLFSFVWEKNTSVQLFQSQSPIRLTRLSYGEISDTPGVLEEVGEDISLSLVSIALT